MPSPPRNSRANSLFHRARAGKLVKGSAPPAPSATPEKDNWSSFAGRAESLVKAGAAVGILCYALGLIVTNTYLTRYGVTDFNALRPQCILIGAWTAVLIALAGAPSLLAIAFLASAHHGASRPSILLRLKAVAVVGVGVLLACIAIMVIGILLVNPFERSFNANLPGWDLVLALMNRIPLLFLIALPEALTDLHESRSTYLALFGPFVFLSCFVIGNRMYEVIAPQMGGGRPQHGLLYFAPDEKELPARLRLLATPYHDKDPERAIVGDLVYMGGDRYAFRVVYCGPSDESGKSKELVYKEQDFVADKKTMQAFFLQGLSERKNGDECPVRR